jgi:hypothetical protein
MYLETTLLGLAVSVEKGDGDGDGDDSPDDEVRAHGATDVLVVPFRRSVLEFRLHLTT